MPNDLVTENQRLRGQLADLLTHARRNERIMQRHQQFDLQCISAGSVRELFECVFVSMRESSELDVVTLCLIDANYDIRRILVELGITLSEFPNLLFVQNGQEWGELQTHFHKPILGIYREELHGVLFPEPLAVPTSLALVPLVRNHEMIGALSLGSFDANRFLHGMATDFVERMSSIIAICVENVINQERLKHIGLTDPLTGVNNRRYIERRLDEEIGRMRRQGNDLSCLYLDIDHFKKINDTIGHQGGDEVLREVASRIKAELRLSDAFGRFGGEEFLVLLIDTTLDDAMNVAERIRVSVAEPHVTLSTGEKLPVTLSIGVASLSASESHEPIENVALSFVANADQALYKAKSQGRNRVENLE